MRRWGLLPAFFTLAATACDADSRDLEALAAPCTVSSVDAAIESLELPEGAIVRWRGDDELAYEVVTESRSLARRVDLVTLATETLWDVPGVRYLLGARGDRWLWVAVDGDRATWVLRLEDGSERVLDARTFTREQHPRGPYANHVGGRHVVFTFDGHLFVFDAESAAPRGERPYDAFAVGDDRLAIGREVFKYDWTGYELAFWPDAPDRRVWGIGYWLYEDVLYGLQIEQPFAFDGTRREATPEMPDPFVGYRATFVHRRGDVVAFVDHEERIVVLTAEGHRPLRTIPRDARVGTARVHPDVVAWWESANDERSLFVAHRAGEPTLVRVGATVPWPLRVDSDSVVWEERGPDRTTLRRARVAHGLCASP